MVRKLTAAAKPRRPFAEGLELEPLRPAPARGRRLVPSAADRAWAAQEFGPGTIGYDVVLEGLRPISGGAPTEAEVADIPPALTWPEWTDADRFELGPDRADQVDEQLAALADAVDRLERGLDGSDLNGGFGHPA